MTKTEVQTKMTDIHVHILPGLDDGAPDIQEAIQMARLASENGVHKMAATPHANRELEGGKEMTGPFWKSFGELKQELAQQQIHLELVPGVEVFFTEDLPQAIKAGEVLSLNHSRYYLVEFPFSIHPGRLWQNVQSLLQMPDVIPVIAHPERYSCVQKDPELIYELVMDGVLTQINKGSITGKFGKKVYRAAMQLLEHNLAGCVASDAHSATVRTPYLLDARAILEKYYSREYAELLLEENPEKILQNEEIEMRAAARPVPKRSFW